MAAQKKAPCEPHVSTEEAAEYEEEEKAGGLRTLSFFPLDKTSGISSVNIHLILFSNPTTQQRHSSASVMDI
jgi:hypothetical protein